MYLVLSILVFFFSTFNSCNFGVLFCVTRLLLQFFLFVCNFLKQLLSSHSDSALPEGTSRRECVNSINFPHKAIYKFYKTSLVPVLSLCVCPWVQSRSVKIGGVFFV
uniref:(northern house mosquito) hypothetical protein n=1 Tax=Culex pipiens TaxID=7175 RepID=A0A8D8FD60_CULPI